MYDKIHRAVLDARFDDARALSDSLSGAQLSDPRLERTFSFAATKGYTDLLRHWIEAGSQLQSAFSLARSAQTSSQS